MRPNGNPGYPSIKAKCFVRADADEKTLREIVAGRRRWLAGDADRSRARPRSSPSSRRSDGGAIWRSMIRLEPARKLVDAEWVGNSRVRDRRRSAPPDEVSVGPSDAARSISRCIGRSAPTATCSSRRRSLNGIGGAVSATAMTPVLYDSPEGQNAAMLAWILEYLGRRDVVIARRLLRELEGAGPRSPLQAGHRCGDEVHRCVKARRFARRSTRCATALG